MWGWAVLGSNSNTSIWNTYLKYIYVFCILYLKYILKMYFVFVFEIHFDVFAFYFSSKKYTIHLDAEII